MALKLSPSALCNRKCPLLQVQVDKFQTSRFHRSTEGGERFKDALLLVRRESLDLLTEPISRCSAVFACRCSCFLKFVFFYFDVYPKGSISRVSIYNCSLGFIDVSQYLQWLIFELRQQQMVRMINQI